MGTIIFANGELNISEKLLQLIKTADYIIAADGGLRHCLEYNQIPDLIIGDFDSINEIDLKSTDLAHVKRISHPTDKNEIDLELALNYSLSLGSDKVIILGAIGGRLDMTIANVLLIAHPNYRPINPIILDGNQEIHLIFGGETKEISGKIGDTVSLIPLMSAAMGITTTGLRYPLVGENLEFAESRGVSNCLLQKNSKIELEKGILLCSIIHTNSYDKGNINFSG